MTTLLNTRTATSLKPASALRHLLAATLCGLSLTAAPLSLAGPDKHYNKHYDKHYPSDRHAPAHQRHNRGQSDYAKVTHVEPIYHTITHEVPQRSCWTETRHVAGNSYQSYTPTILGTLIGGAIGNELGHNKSNQRVGAVLGGVLGGTLARDLSHNRDRGGHTRAVNEEVCEVNYRTEYEQQVVGYNVTYRHQGQSYHTRMDRHPGKRIPVSVHVRPRHD